MTMTMPRLPFASDCHLSEMPTFGILGGSIIRLAVILEQQSKGFGRIKAPISKSRETKASKAPSGNRRRQVDSAPYDCKTREIR